MNDLSRLAERKARHEHREAQANAEPKLYRCENRNHRGLCVCLAPDDGIDPVIFRDPETGTSLEFV